MAPSNPSRRQGNPSDDSRPDGRGPRSGRDQTSPSEKLGRELLSGKSSREILERLFTGDPLELEARCRERIETRAYLLDLTRLHVRAVVRVARGAHGWNGDQSFGEFLLERIDFSIQELLQEDREEELAGLPCADSQDGRYALLAETLGIPPTLARRACAAFNYLPERIRCAYFAVLVQGKPVNRYIAEGHGPPERVMSDIEVAVQTMSDAIRRPRDELGNSHG